MDKKFAELARPLLRLIGKYIGVGPPSEHLSFDLPHGEGGKILADDMGLGKTLEALAFLVSLSQTERHTALVIVPRSSVPL